MQIKVVYPPHVWNIREIRLILDAGDRVGNAMEDDTTEVNDNLTVLTSRLSGIERREKILGIMPNAADTLEDRRTRVHLRWYNKDFYTERLLREKLDGVLGKENYEMDIVMETKTVEVRIKEASKSVFRSIEQMLEDVVPLDQIIHVIIHYQCRLNQYVSVKSVARTQYRIRDGGLEVAADA